MHSTCIICGDMLGPSAEIYATNCGHLFHYACLIQWIERSCTCPQCRCKVTEKTIHRIYFNVCDGEGIKDDAVTLQHKVDNLNFQIKLKDKDVQIYKDKNHKLKSQQSALRCEVKELEQKQSVSESVIHALKEQVAYFKLKSKETIRLNEEVVRLKEKLKNLEDVQLVLTGSKQEVSDMLRHNRDPESLSLLVSTLKKELLEADRKYKLLNMNVKHLQNDVTRYRQENSELKEENKNFKHDSECHKQCESQRLYLKKKIADMEKKLATNQDSIVLDDSLNRIINESPAPQRNRTNAILETSSQALNSPIVSEKVQSIRDSDSPYLQIKSSNVRLSCLVNPKFVTASQSQRTSTSIFKNPEQTLGKVKPSNGTYNYDGLGGHSKEDNFPSPKPVIGLKRSKSATVTSTKFRKLAPNKKISNFFTNSDE